MPASRPHRGRRRELTIALVDDGRQHQEVAAAAGLAPQTLSGIVSGRIRDPRASTRTAIAAALGRPEKEIFPEYAAATVTIDDTVATAAMKNTVIENPAPELTDAQMDFIGAVVFSDIRRHKVGATK